MCSHVCDPRPRFAQRRHRWNWVCRYHLLEPVVFVSVALYDRWHRACECLVHGLVRASSAERPVSSAPLPVDDTQSSSWGSSQRPPSHLRRSLAAAGRRSTRQTRLRTSEWMHQGGTMARHQVHRSRWIACRRRSAAPSITILVFSRGKTVEKCAVGRPPGFLLIPSRMVSQQIIAHQSGPCRPSQARVHHLQANGSHSQSPYHRLSMLEVMPTLSDLIRQTEASEAKNI